MRKKEVKLVITFHTTTEAMHMEKFAVQQRLPGRMIPAPGEVSAGCGLSWKAEPQEQMVIEQKMKAAGISWEEMHIVEI